ncbi:MAG: hypothetical protein MRK02_05145 [Candidatus Scalindua sp.]|nr:hypothetical protein [Candidatus Scalindua sp.]
MKSFFWITAEEGEQILSEILNTRDDAVGTFPQKKKYDDARLLFVDRCTQCHSVNRILLTRKSREEWEKTVSDMREHARKTLLEDWFLSTEFDIIVDLLVKTQGIESEGF